jgi:hypothetical protein
MNGVEAGSSRLDKVHPHPSRRYVMEVYRQFILGTKKRYGTARSQVHYRDFIAEYLEAKRDVLKNKKSEEPR